MKHSMYANKKVQAASAH